MTGHILTRHAIHIHQLQDGLGHRVLHALHTQTKNNNNNNNNSSNDNISIDNDYNKQ